MSVIKGDGKFIVDVKRVGMDIIETIVNEEVNEINYSVIMEILWESLWPVSDAIEDFVQDELKMLKINVKYGV